MEPVFTFRFSSLKGRDLFHLLRFPNGIPRSGLLDVSSPYMNDEGSYRINIRFQFYGCYFKAKVFYRRHL